MIDPENRKHMDRHRTNTYKSKTSFQTIYDAVGYSPGGFSFKGILYIRRSFMPETIKEVRLIGDTEYDMLLEAILPLSEEDK